MQKAELDLRHVMDQLRIIRDASSGVKKVLHDVLEEIENNPDGFEPLDTLPLALQPYAHVVTVRKAYIVHGVHDYRLLFAHAKRHGELDHCVGLCAFRRKAGYAGIDWQTLGDIIDDEFEV